MKRFFYILVLSALTIEISQAQPSTQASNISISPVSGSTTSMRFDWSVGNGSNKVIVVVNDVTSSFTPATNMTYAATTDFSGADIGTGAGKSVCVFNNTSSIGTVPVTGLTAGNVYRIQIFEYTGSAGAEMYNTFGASGNPRTYKVFTASSSWTPPSGISAATVQAWGAGGGGGGGVSSGNGGSGGGGGAYSFANLTSLPPSSMTVTVGSGGSGGVTSTNAVKGGDSWFSPDVVGNALVLAEGGDQGINNMVTTGGTGGNSGVGTVTNGGTGGSSDDDDGGGGGSSAGSGIMGTGAAANNGSMASGGVLSGGAAAPTGGGAGGNGQANLVNDPDFAESGRFPGGGGGGSQDNSEAGGAGGNGLIIISYGIAQATNVDFTAVTSSSMTVNWTNGSGNRRLVIARQGSAIATDPTNSTPYTASSDWNNGSPSGSVIGSGFVVYDGTGNSFTLTNLVAGTYHFAVYEYNGASTSTAIYNPVEATGNRSTVAQASGITITNPAATSLTVNWVNGSGNTGTGTATGTGRIVIVKTNGTTFTPVNGTTYSANTNFGMGGNLGSGGTAKCVFNNTNSTQTVNVTNLTNNTAYTFQVYEYTGSGPGITYTAITATDNPFNRSTVNSSQPSNEATAVTFSSITNNSITYSVSSPGNGASRMILVSTTAISFNPTDGISYTANPDFSAGVDVDPGGDVVKVVGFGSGPIVVTGLSVDQVYSFAAFEFNGTQGTGAENYRNTEYETARNTEPSTQASWGAASGVTNSGMTLNWTQGDGDRRVILMREGSAVNADPTDLTLYAENANWGTKGIVNQEVGTGNYVVYEGASSTNIAITNLQANTTYHFAIYEYNSNDGGVVTNTSAAAFLTPAAIMSQATSSDAMAPTSPTVGAVTAKGGREVAGYWNSTNSTIDIVIPLANDPTLDLGTVQIQLRNTSTSFVNITGTGLSTITYAQRNAGTKTVSVSRADLIATAGFGEAQTLKFNAVITDFSGNSILGTESSTNTLVDEVLPQISGSITFSDNGGMAETLTMTFTETMGLSNNADPVIGTPGFSVSGGSITTGGATKFTTTSPANTLVLQSGSNGDWNPSTTLTYTAAGAGTPGIFMVDLAGNEMATFTLPVSDTDPPFIATGLVFNPNGSSPETITFQVSEELTLSESAAVIGFIPSTGAPTLGNAVYTGKNTTNTITLTSTSDGQWTDAVTIAYTQTGTSNVKDVSLNELANIAAEPILLKSINIASNNAINPTTYAKLNDVISLMFTSSRPLASDPVVTIGTPAQTAIKDGSVIAPNYKYDYNTTPDVINEGAVAISITASETGPPAKQTTATATTNTPVGSSIIYDKTAPLAPTLPDFANGQDNGPSNTDNYTATNTGLVFSGLAGSVENNSTVRLYRAGPIQIGPSATASGAGAWSITVPSLAEGVYSITATATDAAGNVSPASPAINPFTIDNTPPAVTDITLASANPNNTSSVDFTVVFDGGVYNVDIADFTPYGTASGGTSVTNVMMNSPSNYTVTVSGISTLGSLGLNFVDLAANGTVLDFADNEIGGTGDGNGDFASPTQYSIVLPEPPNHVTNFMIDGAFTTSTSMRVTWTDAVGSPSPTGYLITAERSGDNALVPTDFTTPIVAQTDLINNTTGYQYVAPGIFLADWSSLLSGETYTFRIYPFTNSGTDSDYKTTPAAPNQSASTPVGANANIGLWATVSGNIPSTGAPTAVLQFYVCDYCQGLTDNANTKVSSITIQRNAGTDQTGNWTNLIASAELSEDVVNSDPLSTFSGVPRTASGGAITASDITFSGLLSDAFGVVNNNTHKVYYLKLTLQTPMAASLREIIDNLNVSLSVNRSTITLGSGSTAFGGVNQILNSQPFPVNVIATQLDFSTNPDPTQLVLSTITSPSATPDFSTVPVVRARDAFGNTDLNFGGSNIITVSSAITMAPSTITMTNGVASVTSQYQDSGNGQLTASTSTLAANGIAPSPGNSSAVTVNYSALTTLTSGTVGVISTLNCCPTPYQFTITDDGGAGVGDGSPTRISQITLTKKASASPIPDWRDFLGTTNGGTLLYDGTSSYSATVRTINQDNIVVSNMLSTGTTSDLGYIGDGQAKTFTLYIYPDQTGLGGGLPAIVDHLNFDVEVDPANIIFTAQSSTILPSQTAINSGPINIDVPATTLVFTTQPPSDVLVNKDLTANPVVEARDNFGNLNLDYSPSSGVTISNTGFLGMTNIPTAFSNGVLTFPSNFQYTQIGNGTLSVASSTVAAGQGSPPSSVGSNTVTVRVGVASTITPGALTEPAFISSIADDNGMVNPAIGGTDVFDFVINDDPGGTPANENDGNPTRIQQITIVQGGGNSVELSDWTQSIGSAQLSDGTNTLFGVVNPASIVFSAIPNTLSTNLGHIVDNASKTYTLKIWLRETLGGATPAPPLSNRIDGESFQFEVLATNILTNVNGTSIISTESENSGIANEVEVTATQIDFTTQPTAASVNVNISPQIVVSARDANGNLDTEFTGTITGTGNNPIDPGPFTTTNDPTGSFAGGQLTYPSNFQFTAGNGDVELTIDAGGISGTSSVISIITSFDSWLYFDPSFAYTPRIDFANKQESMTTGTSQALARLILSDGGSATSAFNIFTNPQPGVPNQANHQDIDESFTSIDDFTISLANPGDIRSIGLYESDGTSPIGSDVTPAATVTFTGLSGFQAPDGGTYQFYIRASFNETVTDLSQMAMQITNVTHSAGSKFSEQQPVSPPPTIGGVAGGDASPVTILGNPVNRLDVIATSLDFVTPPSPYAGIDEPIGPSYTTPPLPSTSAAIVHARDIFGNLDTDFDYTSAQIGIAGGGASSSKAFEDGILDLDGMTYANAGNGTLTVTAGGLNSSVVPPDDIGNHISGQAVDVIHVGTSLGAIPTPPNLKGGTPAALLMRVVFSAQHSTTTEPSLKKFVFSFNTNPYKTATTTTLKNFKVRLNGSIDVETLGGTVTVSEASSAGNANMDLVIVDFGAEEVNLFDVNTGSPTPVSFDLLADVDVTAKIGTPALTPQLIDLGYTTSTDKDIVVTNGTARSNLVGQTYTFASTRPPVLKSDAMSQTMPYNGQLNVYKGITEIQLEFDVQVWSLDGKAELFDRTNNIKVADLTAINGNFVMEGGTSTPPVNPIRFSIDFINGHSLKDDSLYYVTIKKGEFNNITGTGAGISDDGFNYYGGISSNSILFFKISSPNPPVLSFTKHLFSNKSTGVFQTTFDQRGTAYYMVVPSGSPKPTNDQILGNTVYGPELTRGSYPIILVNEPQTATFNATMMASTNYDIWIFAKNDANLVNIPTTAPYGGSGDGYLVTGTTPTLKFQTPTPSNLKPGFQPDYLLCPASFFTLTEPIIIGETNNNDFQQISATAQDFNILLPPGFEFDGVNKPTVQLIGGDFGAGPSVTFVNNTIVNVSYFNTGATNLDKIVISNLKIRGALGSSPADIKRFSGTASLGGVIKLASIANKSQDQQDFTNSFSTNNDFTAFGFAPGVVITAIPDNYIDVDPTIPGGIRLIPQITPVNDFGISSFTGNGVTNDVLKLSAVTPNTAFDITMIHTNLNGCISDNSVQYVVYDHNTPISDLLGSAGGTQEALNNPNFPDDAVLSFGSADANGVYTANPTPPYPRINYQDVAGYKLLLLKSNVPSSAGTQIISGPAWQTQVEKIVKPVNKITTDPDLPSSLGFTEYNEYQWDYAHILNAVSETVSKPQKVIINPYDNFKQQNNPNSNIHWTGGSLGKVEFTGTYQSTADLTVILPFRQEVELFLPAIPIIEIGSSNASSFDVSDGTINTLAGGTPENHINSFQYDPTGGYPGTAIFCEAGGSIILNGFPAATAGVSSGTFAIYDYQSFNFTTGIGTPLLSPAPGTAFIDNGNGTAQLDPADLTVQNNYNDILVAYTYKDNNSPAIGTGYLIIRITPNPVAQFTISSVVGSPSSTFNAFCSTNAISFDAAPSGIASPSQPGSVNFIAQYLWNFGDPNSGLENSKMGAQAMHTYNISSVYPADLQLTSNWGCPSLPVNVSTPINQVANVLYAGSNGLIRIGDIPSVDFTFTGNCVGDEIKFTDNSSTPGASNSSPANYIWDFDFPNNISEVGNNTNNIPNTSPTTFNNFPNSPNGTSVTHTYSVAKSYQVSLTTTTNLGCSNTKIKTIGQLPLKTPTQTADFSEFFDSSDGGWIALDLSGSTPVSGGSSSWVWNDPTTPGKWSTKSYNGDERSALYTACLDLSTIPRPVISFNSFVDLSTGEGLVLQYSKDEKNIYDPSKGWEVLGTTPNATQDPSPGLDWYNDIGLPSNPGTGYINSENANGFGWSRNPGNIEPKHKLEDLINPDNALSNSRVILRFAFAAEGATGQGITIDSIRVGSRTRTVLMENFTTTNGGSNSVLNSNLASEAQAITDFTVKNITSTQLVNINYHLGFTGTDPFNLDNPSDPSSRALFYNVTKTPYAFLDGIHSKQNGSDLFQDWGAGAYDLQTLQLANADFKPTIPSGAPVTAVTSKSDGSLEIDVVVKPTRDLPSSTKLYIGVLEETVPASQLADPQMITTGEAQFNYVLKKLIPSGVGTRYPKGTFQRDVIVHLGPDGSVNTSDKFTWIPNKLYSDKLAVVLFLQDSTREVYQSELFPNLSAPPPVTGINKDTSLEEVSIYPNPADDEITVVLPAPVATMTRLQIASQLGVITNDDAFEPGQQTKTINTKDLAGGIYFLQLGNGKHAIRKKIMVVHRN